MAWGELHTERYLTVSVLTSIISLWVMAEFYTLSFIYHCLATAQPVFNHGAGDISAGDPCMSACVNLGVDRLSILVWTVALNTGQTALLLPHWCNQVCYQLHEYCNIVCLPRPWYLSSTNTGSRLSESGITVVGTVKTEQKAEIQNIQENLNCPGRLLNSYNTNVFCSVKMSTASVVSQREASVIL